MILLLPVQCRMARAALGLGVRELAAAAKVSIDTVARFERGDELKERTIDALQRALEAAGVEFTNGDQPGVRLTRAAAARSAEAAAASKPSAAAKAIRSQSANAPRKKR
jgi:transcriptional regulator with XRE-family HTH domain